MNKIIKINNCFIVWAIVLLFFPTYCYSQTTVKQENLVGVKYTCESVDGMQNGDGSGPTVQYKETIKLGVGEVIITRVGIYMDKRMENYLKQQNGDYYHFVNPLPGESVTEVVKVQFQGMIGCFVQSRNDDCHDKITISEDGKMIQRGSRNYYREI